MYVVRVVLDRLAHGPRVRGCEPSERCAGQNLHHARAHDVPKAHVREVSDGQRDGVDPVTKSKRANQPHEQRHHVGAVGRGTRASSSQQHLAELDEDDVGGDRERAVEEPEYPGEHHGSADGGGQLLEGTLAREVRRARVASSGRVGKRVTRGRGSGGLALVGVGHW